MRLALALLLLLGACAEAPAPAPPGPAAPAPGAPHPGPLGPPQGRWREQQHWVPVVAANGMPRLLRMRVCRPEGEAAAPLVVLNHGQPRGAGDARGFVALRCTAEAAQWFLARGFALAAPLRRGYGASGGAMVELGGNCANPDFLRRGREAARDIAAALAYARALPGVDGARPAVVVGQSAGGWGTLALAAQAPEGLGLVVNMAGGNGGWANGPNTNCRPDLLESGAGEFGRTARVPGLWIYTENDSYFGPRLAAAMHQAFTAAGGQAELKQLPPWGNDGHGLFFGRDGSATWGPLVEEFLRAHDALPSGQP